MTPRQRSLARHALGLPNLRRRSYRNRYVATYAPHGAYDEWAKMVDQGFAERSNTPMNGGTCYRFWLTEAGAKAAVESGETLCPEDFPNQSN